MGSLRGAPGAIDAEQAARARLFVDLHGPDGARLLGFDNAHPVEGARGAEQDHKHRLRAVRAYHYRDAAALVADFWAEVEALLREKGVWS